jgi:hypothetical protein
VILLFNEILLFFFFFCCFRFLFVRDSIDTTQYIPRQVRRQPICAFIDARKLRTCDCIQWQRSCSLSIIDFSHCHKHNVIRLAEQCDTINEIIYERTHDTRCVLLTARSFSSMKTTLYFRLFHRLDSLSRLVNGQTAMIECF